MPSSSGALLRSGSLYLSTRNFSSSYSTKEWITSWCLIRCDEGLDWVGYFGIRRHYSCICAGVKLRMQPQRWGTLAMACRSHGSRRRVRNSSPYEGSVAPHGHMLDLTAPRVEASRSLGSEYPGLLQDAFCFPSDLKNYIHGTSNVFNSSYSLGVLTCPRGRARALGGLIARVRIPDLINVIVQRYRLEAS